MADKITKFLLRLPSKDRERILSALKKLMAGKVADMDIKALKNQHNLFRARVGRIRIIYYRDKDYFEVRRITNRDDKTYRNL